MNKGISDNDTFYNFHDLLTLKITRPSHQENFKDLNSPFSFFESSQVADPDIELRIGKFVPSNEHCSTVDHKFYVRENYFYCRDSGGSANWEFEIFGFEDGKTHINWHSKFWGPEKYLYPDLLVQDILIRPLIEYKLNLKKYLLIHACGISKNDRGYVFIGRGSSFKTSLVMDFIRKENFKLLGDDRVIISDDTVLNFPVHINSLNFKIKKLENENFRNASHKIALNSIINYISFLKFLKNTPYPDYSDIISGRASLESVFFINRSTKDNLDIRLNTIDYVTGSKKIELNNKSDTYKGHTFFLFDYGQYFYRYVLAYSFIFPENKLLNHGNLLITNAEKILNSKKFFNITIPRQYTEKTFTSINNLISKPDLI